MTELSWGILLVAYLFVGGMAGGSYLVAALADLFGKGRYRVLSKSGTYISLLLILVGLVLLVLDLGRFEVDPLSPLNAYINFPNSIMSIGTWIVTGFMMVSLLTSILWFFNGSSIIRKLLEIVGIALGGSTATYTGLLLAFSRGRALWNTPFLPWLFIVSGVLTGLALTFLFIPIVAKLIPRFFEDFKELFDNRKEFVKMLRIGQRYLVSIIAIELVLVVLELVLTNIYSEMQHAGLSMEFIVYLIAGLIFPLGVGVSIENLKFLKNERTALIISVVGLLSILFGGFLLRYILLTAGQVVG
ncbi:polysulfide reductase NrfD [Candidatus Bathyarchaeota archaeon]|nr:polysulfide reductase NrfD [Candidatus Bathyarchaeota archaeon]